jgi:hypothetical protein
MNYYADTGKERGYPSRHEKLTFINDKNGKQQLIYLLFPF